MPSYFRAGCYLGFRRITLKCLSINAGWVGCMSDRLNLASQKWEWVLIGFFCFCHSSNFSLQLWFLSCLWSLTTAAVVSRRVVTSRGFYYPLMSEQMHEWSFCGVNNVRQGYTNCCASCGRSRRNSSSEFMFSVKSLLYYIICILELFNGWHELSACRRACCAPVRRQRRVTETVSQEVSCSARMFNVLHLPTAVLPELRQDFPLEYCCAARWWTCFILNVTALIPLQIIVYSSFFRRNEYILYVYETGCAFSTGSKWQPGLNCWWLRNNQRSKLGQ